MLEIEERKCFQTVSILAIRFNILIAFIFLFLQWPYCDGSHAAHNTECGDNLGPVVLQRKK